MDYEKKYNEALERAKSFEEKYGGGYSAYIFPELAESDDERTRKDFIEFLADVNRNYKLIPARYMDWIEKQKELFESGRGLYYYDGEKTIYCGYPATEDNP